MDYFDDVSISTFSMEGQKAPGLYIKYLKLCSEDEWTLGLEMT